jgi:phosphoribosylaminoimidazole-succinocarboxamide synthase
MLVKKVEMIEAEWHSERLSEGSAEGIHQHRHICGIKLRWPETIDKLPEPILHLPQSKGGHDEAVISMSCRKHRMELASRMRDVSIALVQ